MVIYKSLVSAASDAHGASLHNNQNNKTSHEPINRQKINKDVESHIAVQKQFKFKQILPSMNMSSSFLKSMQRV